MLTALEQAIVIGYAGAIALLALFGLHRLHLLRLVATAPDRAAGPALSDPAPEGRAEPALPSVTVQVPLYNERYVAERVLRAVAALDWPRDRLEVQALDDSTDATRAVVDTVASELRAAGTRVEVLRRPDRDGFKAGALAAGLAAARGELVAIFDADFVPPRDWLRRVAGEFADPGVGMVQTAWGHLNADASLLTRAQADFLQGHFALEHHARAAHGLFFNFNGTAGIWRRVAIEAAGGWQGDTLTEDLDLSYRAQLAGWRFVYRPDVVVPAELPTDYTAYRNQQRRWTKGALEVAWKLLPRLLRTPGLGAARKAEACAHLLANVSYLVMAGLALLMAPMLAARRHAHLESVAWLDLATLLLASGSVGAFYYVAQRREGKGAALALARVPLLMAVGIALSFNNARAVAEGLLRVRSPFERTAKFGEAAAAPRPRRGLAYAGRGGAQNVVEIVLALASWGVFGWGVLIAPPISWPFLGLFLAGLTLAGCWSAGELLAARAPRRREGAPRAASHGAPEPAPLRP